MSIVVTRWWDQYNLLPWPDNIGIMCVGMFSTRQDERARLMRRNVVRYVILSYCIALRTVSFKLKKRFPDLEHLVLTGVMREDELRLFRTLDSKVSAGKIFNISIRNWRIFNLVIDLCQQMVSSSQLGIGHSQASAGGGEDTQAVYSHHGGGTDED